MINAITEGFLGDYFLFESIIGRFADLKRLFDVIGKIWCVKKDDIEKLWSETNDDDLRAIKDADDYFQYLRMCEYCTITNRRSVSVEKKDLIDLKGKALDLACKCKITTEKCFLKSNIIDLLTDNAACGNVIALRVLGILICEGFIDELSVAYGKDCLFKALNWGDITANLAAIKYGYITESAGVGNLAAATENTYNEQIVQDVANTYNVDFYIKSKEISLLRAMFERGKAKKQDFNEKVCKIIKGNTMGTRDKEKLLFDDVYSYEKESYDIPLELPFNKIEIDTAVFNNLPLCRNVEVSNIVGSLKDNDLRADDNYRPLCICGESKYVKEMYISAISKSFINSNVARIDATKLNPVDFERNSGNVFIRNIEECRNNIYIFELYGDINDFAIEQIEFFLQSANRRDFLLSRPLVRLDLSSILCICVCDKDYYNAIKKHVDVISFSEVNCTEKENVIKDIITKKEKKYFVKSYVKDETIQNISKLSTDTLDLTLDKLFKQNRKNKNAIVVDAQDVLALSNDNYSHKRYGFGGVYVE